MSGQTFGDILPYLFNIFFWENVQKHFTNPSSYAIQSIVQPDQAEAHSILRKVDMRIVQGKEAIPHSIPWQVLVENVKYIGYWGGGSLISRAFVLTAAHVVKALPGDPPDWGNKRNFRVYTGLHSREGLLINDITFWLPPTTFN